MAMGDDGDNGSRKGSVNFRVLDEAWDRLGDRLPVGVRVAARAGLSVVEVPSSLDESKGEAEG